MRHAWLLFPFAVLVSSSACDRRGGLSGRFAEVVIVVPAVDATGLETLTRDAQLTFPPAPMGEASAGQIVVRNVGDAPLTLSRVRLVSGSPAFALELPQTVTLEAQQETTLGVTFSPEQDPDPSRATVLHEAIFELETEGGRAGETLASIGVEAVAEARDCYVPRVLDFGDVPLNQAVLFPLSLANGSSSTTVASFSPIGGPDPAFFSVDLTSPLEVEPGSRARLLVRFSPQAELAYRAELTVRRRPSCPEGRVELVGRGSAQGITWSPTELSFGRLPIDAAATRAVTITNGTGVALTLTTAVQGDGFSLRGAPAEVPARGSATVEVECKPPRLGALTGTLSLDLGTTPTLPGRVGLRCSGGGPRLRVSPAPLVFGQVPLLNGADGTPLSAAQQTSVTRRLRLENVGTPPMQALDPSYNLVLGREGAPPFLSLTPLGATTSGEYSVALVRPDPAGVPAVIGRNFFDVEVTLRPVAAGVRDAVLSVYSNDGVEPVQQVRVTAVAQASQRCLLSVTPVGLGFGDVAPGSSELLTVQVRNNAQTGCLVSGVEIASGSHPGFTLASGQPSFLVGPGQVVAMQVRFDATGLETGTAASGFLRLVGAGSQAPTLVGLSARVARCLVTVPDEVDFGNIKLGCGSSGRTVQVFNTCGSPVRLSSFGVVGAPFAIAASPAIPAGGLLLQPSTSAALTVTYRPPDLGTHTGTLELRGQEGASTRTFPVPLRGVGDNTGTTVESYVQPAQSMADVLFTIDDSCSMADEQLALGNNFTAFIRYATLASVNYQLAVVTTNDSGINGGAFVPRPSEPLILTNATPDVANVFRRRVDVGTFGAGIERPLSTTLKALTPPLITGPHQGFLRDDANLAIIIVSDAQDQSMEPITYYVTRLPLVKGVRRRHQVTISVIGPFSPQSTTCMTEGQDMTGRYDAVIQATRGVKQTICKSDWASDLEQLGRTALGPRNTFFVRNPPDTLQPVDVTVNGQTVSNAWTYDPTSNTIVFADGQQPGAGTTVTITYQSMCL
ncbi:MAG: choice-of-anchor D domain-containing protein [Myxococcaceae bacterium]|nr:choice-of-anchor D domain-containing protein [Myxococcaceae bacterium]